MEYHNINRIDTIKKANITYDIKDTIAEQNIVGLQSYIDNNFHKNAKQIVDSDLCQLDPGFYWADHNNGCSNKPQNVTAFSLTILRTGINNRHMTLISGAHKSSVENGDIFHRDLNEGNWGDWYKDGQKGSTIIDPNQFLQLSGQESQTISGEIKPGTVTTDKVSSKAIDITNGQLSFTGGTPTLTTNVALRLDPGGQGVLMQKGDFYINGALKLQGTSENLLSPGATISATGFRAQSGTSNEIFTRDGNYKTLGVDIPASDIIFDYAPFGNVNVLFDKYHKDNYINTESQVAQIERIDAHSLQGYKDHASISLNVHWQITNDGFLYNGGSGNRYIRITSGRQNYICVRSNCNTITISNTVDLTTVQLKDNTYLTYARINNNANENILNVERYKYIYGIYSAYKIDIGKYKKEHNSNIYYHIAEPYSPVYAKYTKYSDGMPLVNSKFGIFAETSLWVNNIKFNGGEFDDRIRQHHISNIYNNMLTISSDEISDTEHIGGIEIKANGAEGDGKYQNQLRLDGDSLRFTLKKRTGEENPIFKISNDYSKYFGNDRTYVGAQGDLYLQSEQISISPKASLCITDNRHHTLYSTHYMQLLCANRKTDDKVHTQSQLKFNIDKTYFYITDKFTIRSYNGKGKPEDRIYIRDGGTKLRYNQDSSIDITKDCIYFVSNEFRFIYKGNNAYDYNYYLERNLRSFTYEHNGGILKIDFLRPDIRTYVIYINAVITDIIFMYSEWNLSEYICPDIELVFINKTGSKAVIQYSQYLYIKDEDVEKTISAKFHDNCNGKIELNQSNCYRTMTISKLYDTALKRDQFYVKVD